MDVAISSVESQKGVIAAERCSVENQKGAIAVQSQWFSTVFSGFQWFSTVFKSVVFNGTSLICNNALLALNWRYGVSSTLFLNFYHWKFYRETRVYLIFSNNVYARSADTWMLNQGRSHAGFSFGRGRAKVYCERQAHYEHENRSPFRQAGVVHGPLKGPAWKL